LIFWQDEHHPTPIPEKAHHALPFFPEGARSMSSVSLGYLLMFFVDISLIT